VQVATLRAHGDFGLGTFEGSDSEMVVLDTAVDLPIVSWVADATEITSNTGMTTQHLSCGPTIRRQSLRRPCAVLVDMTFKTEH
jgi:Alpha-acetolactate decarboxylase